MQRALFVLTVCVYATLALRAGPATQPLRLPTTQAVTDIHGKSIAPLQLSADHRCVVLIFISTDCPISNSYAPLLADLCRTCSESKIDFFTVYADDHVTADAAMKHHDQYNYPCDALLDPDGSLAKLTGATRTPEAVVIETGGGLLYRGRIDDQYVAVGKKRFAATTHELRDVLSAIASGRPITTVWMPAMGCSIH